jgi:hypothetical protein
MKTTIVISGSLNSALTLRRSIVNTANCEVETHFNNFFIHYPTKKEAVKALSEGYRCLVSDYDDWKKSCATYSYGRYMRYDSASAVIKID